MITLQDSLPAEKTGTALIHYAARGTEIEAEYYKDAETGDVIIVAEDDVDRGSSILLTLHMHDGADSEYTGMFAQDGQFVPYGN